MKPRFHDQKKINGDDRKIKVFILVSSEENSPGVWIKGVYITKGLAKRALFMLKQKLEGLEFEIKEYEIQFN